jgi:D-alanyl-D-alanine carboxypeptidase
LQTSIIFRPFVALIIFLATALLSPVYAYEPPRAALLVDVDGERVIFEENASETRHPASLTKMMTLYLVFEALEAGILDLDTPVTGSRYSADRPPSRLGLSADESIPVDLAIDALVVRSANDVAAAVGELLAGSEPAFAELMTKKAAQLGMKDTIYKNASGLPNKEQVTTAHDQAVLGLALHQHFPQYFPRFSVPEVTYKDRTWKTHNKLLNRIDSVTGIKTGFINASGFNIVTYDDHPAGAKLVVVMGGRTARERDNIAISLLEGKIPAHKQGAGSNFVKLTKDAPSVPAVKQLFVGEKRLINLAKGSTKPLVPLSVPNSSTKPIINLESVSPIVAQSGPALLPPNVDPIQTASATKPEVSAEPIETINRYAIQVGVLPTLEGARKRLADARPSFSDANNELRQFTLPLQTSRGTHYRARIVGFASMQAAFDACGVMENKNIECMALVQK